MYKGTQPGRERAIPGISTDRGDEFSGLEAAGLKEKPRLMRTGLLN